MAMRSDDFQFMADLLKRDSGLIVTEDKVYLLESRLLPVARRFQLEGLDDICRKLRTVGDTALAKAVVEAMTTNESSFFRDQKPFDTFKTLLLPKFLAARAATKKIRIWSAACSSGQEAYSLAMMLMEEMPKMPGWQFEIVGTDLSSEMVERATNGLYTQFEVQRGLPMMHLVKYFQKVEDKWQLSKPIRDMAQFRTYNLLSDLGALGRFDIIFCRNVLIYFDIPTKAKVFDSMSRIIAPDGALFLGGAETTIGITDKFKQYEGQSGLYTPA